MQSIMINRKFGGISDFSAPSPQRTIFLLFRFSLFPSFEKTAENENRNEKSHIFAVFARKRPFLSQIKRWFSVFYGYIGQITPHPPLLALAGWVSSRPKFFIFYFFIFCKILWFFKFRFSTEFWAFSRISYLLLILHKFSRYSFSLIFVRCGAFYVALRYSLSPSYFERLRIQFSSYLRLFSFLRKNKVVLWFKVRFCYIRIAVLCDIDMGLMRSILLRGWVYSLLYTGVDIPYYGCARGYNGLFTCYYYMGIAPNVKFSI